MRQYLSSLIPALLLAMPLMAEEGTQPPAPPVPPKAEMPPGAMPPGGMPGGPMKPEVMKEIREVEGQLRALKEKTDQDPEVAKLKQVVDDAQKAYKAKAEEVMAKDPTFAGLKARRDEVRAKFGPRPDAGNRPGDAQGHKKDMGDNKPPAPPAPPVVPAQ